MNWHELTAPRLVEAIRETGGVCMVPVSVIERHGDHLPLGTDMLWGQAVAEAAAKIEPALVFPPYWFGQIHEARHQPGTIALPRRLLLDVLEAVCDEIARNGCRRIVLLNAHGGNEAMLPYFAQCTLESERDYVVHVIRLGDKSAGDDERWRELKETDVDAHAGEAETSRILAVREELVETDRLGDDPSAGQPLGRLAHLAGGYTGIDWYADFPDHYAGDGRAGAKEKGELLLEIESQKVADILRSIKRSDEPARLTREFYTRARDPMGE